MKQKIQLLVTLVIGLVLGSVLMMFQGENASEGEQAEQQKQPLYWVAPMDSNYRRDKPGKSPMGMDLIPVYEEDLGNEADGPGVVKIAPHVVNNLGVRTTEVKTMDLHRQIKTVGYVQYDEDNLVHIHPRIDGWIERLYVKAEGDPVEKGQPLYSLYSPQLVNAQEEYLLALKRNNRDLINAARARLLALQVSEQFVQELKASGSASQSVLFYAPQSGVIDALKTREGFYVQPGNTLMSIGKLEQVWVEAEVFERDAALIKSGQSVTMTLDYLPGRSWPGKVDYVYPSLDAKTRTLRVRLKFDNRERLLKPNMFAKVTIHADAQENALLVPREAVIRTGDQDRVVLVMGEGQYKSVAVKIGRISDDVIEILDGLNGDDRVVTSAQFLIDSESSKSSDFQRMSPNKEPDAVWMEGEINSVQAEQRSVNITHDAVPAWGWPEMTMDFDVAESVDMQALKAGYGLHFEVTKLADGGYSVTGIHVMGPVEKDYPKATVSGVINGIDRESRTLNISREAIAKWNRGPATMDFVLAQNLPLDSWQAGDAVRFTFEVRDDLVITAIAADSKQHQDHSGH